MPRVLIVEDSRTQAEELRMVLESEDFEVEAAFDAESALRDFAAAEFDMVISDIVMPGLSGFELCRKIKENPASREVPVIMLTSLSDPMDIIQSLECGADNFVTKPYEPSRLLARVRSILEHRRLRREGSPEAGTEILFLGRKFVVTSDREQVLDLLVSTFEDTVRTNRELQATQAAVQAANKELEAFSYSVSHDLRAPLRVIDGYSRALLEEHLHELGDQGRHYLRRIRAAAERMGELIEDLLQLSRVTRAELSRAKVPLAGLARAVAEELQRAEPGRPCDFAIQDVPAVAADGRLMRVLLENLIGNAWKFTAKTPRPRIEFGAESRPEGTVYFVRDNGVGFDMAYAHRLFTPFQRLHGEAEFPGTGIGLATVHRIVARHGGRVWAEGQVGRGASVFFTLEEPGTELPRAS